MTTTPSIEVKTLDNKSINILDKYYDNNLLILFYNNDCLGCTGRAIPLAHKMMQEFKEIEAIGIHSNFNRTVTKDEIIEIFTSKEIPFPIYIDEEHKVYDLYKCEGTPHWVIINKKGKIYRSFFGSQGNSQTRLWYALSELTQPTKESK